MTIALVWALSAAVFGAVDPDARTTTIDANRLHMATASTSFTTPTSTPLDPWAWQAELMGWHLADPIVMTDADGAVTRDIVGSRQQVDLAMALGIRRWLMVDATLPIVMHQRATYAADDLGALSSAGIADLRLGVRGSAPPDMLPGPDLTVSVDTTLPTGAEGAWMGAPGMTTEPRLTLSHAWDRWTVAARGGYRVQPHVTVFNAVIGNGPTAGLAATFSPKPPWTVVAELDGAARQADLLGDPAETPLELLLGGRHMTDAGLGVVAGLGTGLIGGLPTPTWRAFAGLTWHTSRPSVATLAHVEDAQSDADPLDAVLVAGPEDRDDDGVADVDDQCADTAEDIDGVADEDGCPETDADADGVLDELDTCPQEPGDANGCPSEGLVAIEANGVLLDRRVHFAIGSTTLPPTAEDVLRPVLVLLMTDPTLQVRVVGHADRSGSAARNRALSQARAEAVRAWLIAHAPAQADLSGRLQAVGRGEAQPLPSDDQHADPTQDRRVEFEPSED